MLVISRRLDVIVEALDCVRDSCPCARFGAGGAVIKVVVNEGGRLIRVHFAFGQRDQAVRACVDDIVSKDVVRHIPLHLELAASGRRSIVFIKRVVDDRGVLGMSPIGRIAADGHTRGVAVIDKIIAGSDVARRWSLCSLASSIPKSTS